MAKIAVGISSWADPELLKSGFYPPGLTAGAARLSYYASQFSIVEMDAAYHFLPSLRYLQNWLEAVPPGFVFDVKAFSLLTQHPTALTAIPRDLREASAPFVNKEGHLYPHNLPPQVMDKVWERFARFLLLANSSDKLGLVSFQFPTWFHANPANYAYLRECRRRLPDLRIGVEFRTPGWLTEHLEETLAVLRENQIALICVDEPQGLKTSLPAISEFTANPAVVRFHGRNTLAWEDKTLSANLKYNYLYKESELNEWVPKIRKLAAQSDAVYVLFKNKHLDYAVQNARMLQRMLGV